MIFKKMEMSETIVGQTRNSIWSSLLIAFVNYWQLFFVDRNKTAYLRLSVIPSCVKTLTPKINLPQWFQTVSNVFEVHIKESSVPLLDRKSNQNFGFVTNNAPHRPLPGSKRSRIACFYSFTWDNEVDFKREIRKKARMTAGRGNCKDMLLGQKGLV